MIGLGNSLAGTGRPTRYPARFSGQEGGDRWISERTFLSWPVVRQLTGPDGSGRGSAVQSAHTRAIEPRTVTADRVVKSICPYCAVGCGQKVFVSGEKVVQIEGDPDSPDLSRPVVPQGVGE